MKSTSVILLRTIMLFGVFGGLMHLITCSEEPVYRQLSGEQLEYLYAVDTNYMFSGETEEFYDTIYFLKNYKDTLEVPVRTRMSRQLEVFNTGFYDINGVSDLDFKTETFKIGTVSLVGGTGHVSISLGILQTNFNSLIPTPPKNISMNETMPTDTAIVNGIVYQEVHKYSAINQMDFLFILTGFNRVYFDKRFGFVLIETNNGTILELLKK
mgnify:CR=1 FL=1